MSALAANLVLALIWAALTGDISSGSLLSGLVVGFFALWMVQPILGLDPLYFRRMYRGTRLAVFFLWELLKSSVEVAVEVLRLRGRARPAFVEMPLDVKSDLEIMLVANLISLTPGTLSLEVMPDRSTLIVHAMFGDDPDALVASMKNGLERMVKEAFE